MDSGLVEQGVPCNEQGIPGNGGSKQKKRKTATSGISVLPPKSVLGLKQQSKAEILAKLKGLGVPCKKKSKKEDLQKLLDAEEAALATIDSRAALRVQFLLVLQRHDTWTELGGFHQILQLSLVCKSWNLLIQREDCILTALARLRPMGFIYLHQFYEKYMFYPDRTRNFRCKDTIQ